MYSNAFGVLDLGQSGLLFRITGLHSITVNMVLAEGCFLITFVHLPSWCLISYWYCDKTLSAPCQYVHAVMKLKVRVKSLNMFSSTKQRTLPAFTLILGNLVHISTPVAPCHRLTLGSRYGTHIWQIAFFPQFSMLAINSYEVYSVTGYYIFDRLISPWGSQKLIMSLVMSCRMKHNRVANVPDYRKCIASCLTLKKQTGCYWTYVIVY